MSGVTANTQSIYGAGQANDSYSRNIRNQIANAQKQLQELSSNEELSLEEKMKKRQEINQEISSLNNQLRQHQIEQRREQQQAKGSSMENMLGGKRQMQKKSAKAGASGAGMQTMSQATTAAIISADSSMKQAQVQGSVASGMENRAGVLKIEIKMDAARGNSVEEKQEELAEVEQTAAKATASQLNTLGEANRGMKEAQEADQAAGKTKEESIENEKQAEAGTEAGGNTETGKAENKTETGRTTEAGNKIGKNKAAEAGTGEREMSGAEMTVPGGSTSGETAGFPAAYTPVDIRL